MFGIVKVIILSMVMLVQHNQAFSILSDDSPIIQFKKSEIAELENRIEVAIRLRKNGEIHFTIDDYYRCEFYNVYAAYGGSDTFTIVEFKRWLLFIEYTVLTVTPGACKVPPNPDEVVVVCTDFSRNPLYRSHFIINQPKRDCYVSCGICFIFIFIFCVYLLFLSFFLAIQMLKKKKKN